VKSSNDWRNVRYWPIADISLVEIRSYKPRRTQRRGEQTASRNKRDFPDIVEMPVRPGGFRKRLDAMHEFHRSRGLDHRRGHGFRRDDQDCVRWCFADRRDADAFAKTFTGKTYRREGWATTNLGRSICADIFAA
jgi:hypothetical protein